MIIATAAVCLLMDGVTFTAMTVAKPYVARVSKTLKLGVASQCVTDAMHRRVVALRAAAHTYKECV